MRPGKQLEKEKAVQDDDITGASEENNLMGLDKNRGASLILQNGLYHDGTVRVIHEMRTSITSLCY